MAGRPSGELAMNQDKFEIFLNMLVISYVGSIKKILDQLQVPEEKQKSLMLEMSLEMNKNMEAQMASMFGDDDFEGREKIHE